MATVGFKERLLQLARERVLEKLLDDALENDPEIKQWLADASARLDAAPTELEKHRVEHEANLEFLSKTTQLNR